MALKFKPFGYKLDYDKEIAIDRSRLEALERSQRVCETLPLSVVVKMHDYMDCGMTTAVDVLTCAYRQNMIDAVAGLLGIETSLALDILFWIDSANSLSIAQRSPGSYNRAEAAVLSLAWFQYDTKAGFRKSISKAKASLSRHLRNKERHG